MGKTKIEWAETVWNPVTGCSKVSEGCRHCYAERMAKRLAGRAGYPKKDPFAVTLHYDRLVEPLSWRKPRRVFVCSMSDLFHPSVPNQFIAAVWCAMQNVAQPGHIFMVLTKRPERMAALTGARLGGEVMLPLLPNAWLGTSVEDQAAADERIPHLLQCPAALRFVSYEPTLGPVDFTRVDYTKRLVEELTAFVRGRGRDPEKELVGYEPGVAWINALTGEWCDGEDYGKEKAKLDWVIAGGESGPKARPAHPEWFRSARDQCQTAGVPFFFKQWGEWIPKTQRLMGDLLQPRDWGVLDVAGEFFRQTTAWNGRTGEDSEMHEEYVHRVGKKAAGRLLDGQEHSAYPQEARP